MPINLKTRLQEATARAILRFAPSILPFGLHAPISGALSQATGKDNSVVIAIVHWLSDAMDRSPLQVRKIGTEEILKNHRVLDFLNEPYEGWTWAEWLGVIIDGLIIDGAMYALQTDKGLKLFDQAHTSIRNNIATFNTDENQYYQVDIRDTKNLIIFYYRRARDGKVAGPLHGTVLDEIAADNTRSIKMRLGIVRTFGGSPIMTLKESGRAIPKDRADTLKEEVRSYQTSEFGDPMISPEPLEVHYPPPIKSQMDWRGVSSISEERIAAACRVRLDVIGLGEGLRSTRIGATMREAIKESWQGGVIPLQNRLASQTNCLVSRKLSQFQ